ncbi:hypothetical protein [Cystobacter ferrugineus]|uniref:Uncharacterized protein n=1 Tax=Cystobacter ferrugineus TaxID=83449 RepID=A0A1L9B166_9BACT|nr:hypothetical protein [Cystobacter ferrugineus]OJH35995.1 hypothetical protein BON30_35945 [Cystobacter ferrugineus]
MPDLTGPHFSPSFGPTPPGSLARAELSSGLAATWTLPSFVSSAAPRSEGEALLRRIFSRGTRM